MQLLFIFVVCDFASCKKIFVCAKFFYNISDDLPKKSQKNAHLSIDLSITIRVFWSRHLAGPPGRFAVCPWRNRIPQVNIWFEKGAAKRGKVTILAFFPKRF